MNGPFEDRRLWFAVYVTGRADLIPAGLWMHDPQVERILERVDAWPLVRYLDGVLWKKKLSHRVAIYCRDEPTGVDAVVRAYAKVRLGAYHLATPERDVFDSAAQFRRDLGQLARSHALVWYGPREDPAVTGRPDPVTIAALLGIMYRVVPFPVASQEGSPDAFCVQADERSADSEGCGNQNH